MLAVIAVGAVLVLKIFSGENNNQNNNQSPISSTGQPIRPADNPARSESLDQTLNYGCGGPGSFKPEKIEDEDKIWPIKKDGSEAVVSLGKYKIQLPERIVIDVDKIWIYFMSDALGRSDDKWYGVENSYVSGISLNVNGYEQPIKLGGDSYMFIELTDSPLGDWYPYIKNQYLKFEILVKLKCKEIKDGKCIDNDGQLLEKIDNADIKSNIRIFATGCQPFLVDLSSSAKIDYK